jgi:outer membrane protein OmpA-like peptidoglycan-associated protein
MIAYNAQMTMPGQPSPPLDAGAREAYPPSEVVVAYADTAGSTAYNLRLSERRAKAAADALVALGVPPAGIQTSWKGEADPAVDTGDNVREPLNRRVTIHVSAGGY